MKTQTVIQWRRLSGERIWRPIVEELDEVLWRERSEGHELKVCIGTDSQVKGRVTAFATVIVFIRQGKGGFMFIREESTRQRMTVKERMLAEVGRSVEAGYELSGLFTRYGVAMELHADINTNPKFRSNEALREAMSYILAMGFAFRAKPEAFASSSCANRLVQ